MQPVRKEKSTIDKMKSSSLPYDFKFSLSLENYMASTSNRAVRKQTHKQSSKKEL